MSTEDLDSCKQLRKAHARLTNELKLLRESIAKAEHDGVDPAIEARNSVKVLQASLHTIAQKLEKCPPDPNELAVVNAQQQAKALRDVNHWFPESEEHDIRSDDEFESIADEP
ncbi:MAG TPA: hypothetical protein VKX46_22705 [Ktedonobacteraceae bacterium]|nr:hypothetical protein [Ktedonobacteraceae bacterium]